VVDNDAEHSGEPSAETARAEGLEIRYVCEPRRGIARARNLSVAEARGEWIAFIDDDEEADRAWLAQLWREVSERGAEAGIGPVIPRCSDAPSWLVDGGFFERHRFPTGTILHAGYTRAGNALLHRAALSSLVGPFDERYDLTGGEDNNLFARLIEQGARVIAVDSAIVYEHLSAPRTTARWLLRRRFFVGIGMARLEETIGRPDTWRRRVRLLASVLGNGGAGLLLFPVRRGRAFGLLMAAVRDLGRLAFLYGFLFRPYASAAGIEMVRSAEPTT
jgi:glycosyltransferase involved in cell wall biosynthesis